MKDNDKLFKMMMELMSMMAEMLEYEDVEPKKHKTKEEKHQLFENVFKKLEDNWILDGDVLLGLLKYYIEIKEIDKCYKIVFVLARHYPDKIENIYKIWGEAEEYEKCQQLKMILRSITS